MSGEWNLAGILKNGHMDGREANKCHAKGKTNDTLCTVANFMNSLQH